ncbi:hypothetical protein E4T56_gene19243 [Termitomyces sp. T112]|nr:hypothetical protein E4T56_gene19243 [Termitomyces sp. T112]
MRRCTFIDSWIIPSTRVAPRPPLVIEDDAEEENSVSPEYKRRSSLIFAILTFDFAIGFFAVDNGIMSIEIIFLISLEGVCGIRECDSPYRPGTPRPAERTDVKRTKQEREFRIDSILLANLYRIF